MEALREAFRRVAGRRARIPPACDAPHGHGAPLPAPPSRGPPALPARLSAVLEAARRWSPVPEPPLTRSGYAQLSQRLNGACDPLLIGRSGTQRSAAHDARQRPGAGSSIRSARRRGVALGAALRLDAARNRAHAHRRPRHVERSWWSSPRSLLILGAAEIATTRRLLAATAALAMGPADTLLLVSPDGTGRIRTERGASIATTPAGLRPLLDIVRPDLVALDPALGGASSRSTSWPRSHASSPPRVGQDPASLPARWVFRHRLSS